MGLASLFSSSLVIAMATTRDRNLERDELDPDPRTLRQLE